MNLLPDTIDQREQALLAPYAMFSRDSKGRVFAEPDHPYRGPFQRDRDRILHTSAFRRLSGKTQVFNGHMGDYHRTRLTHTMEVASIARTLGRALKLNEDLIEALVLLHDIGHPPFGHAGEDALNECLADDGGFSHNRFALTLVTEIENPYAYCIGLNLTREVLECQMVRIDKTSKLAPLLEAQIVDLADSITYDAHDVDDAVKLRLLTIDELKTIPLVAECLHRTAGRHGILDDEQLRRTLIYELIDQQVNDLLVQAQSILSVEDGSHPKVPWIVPSPPMIRQKEQLESFLYENVYRHDQIMRIRNEAQHRLKRMFTQIVEKPTWLPEPYQVRAEKIGIRCAVRDYLAGMTDKFCMQSFESIFPRSTSALNLRNPV